MSLIFSIVCTLGDVQIGLINKKGQLEVEVIRARGLTPKPGSKSLPGKGLSLISPYSMCLSFIMETFCMSKH